MRVKQAQLTIDQTTSELTRLNDALRIVSVATSKAFRDRPEGASSDLSFTELYEADFSRVDFAVADLTGAWIEHCVFANADLSRVRSFDYSQWNETQWWLAKAISTPLLEYLKENYPFKSDQLRWANRGQEGVRNETHRPFTAAKPLVFWSAWGRDEQDWQS